MNDDLLNVLQVSKILKTSYKTTLKYVKSGKLPYIIVKNSKNLDTYMVKKTDLDVYMEIQGKTLTTKNDKPKQAHRGDRTEVDLLRKRVLELELLHTHFIQELQVKNQQIKDFTGIVEKLQNTNQYLLIGKKPIDTPINTPSPDDTIDIQPHTTDTPDDTTTGDKVDVIALIMKKVMKGKTDKQISGWLNKKGIPTLSNKGIWHAKQIYRIKTSKK